MLTELINKLYTRFEGAPLNEVTKNQIINIVQEEILTVTKSLNKMIGLDEVFKISKQSFQISPAECGVDLMPANDSTKEFIKNLDSDDLHTYLNDTIPNELEKKTKLPFVRNNKYQGYGYSYKIDVYPIVKKIK